MFATLQRTWVLTKQSFAVLSADKEILLFPVMSAIAAVAVSATFLAPVFMTGAFASGEDGAVKPILYLWLFLFYYANYFVIIFFNSALVACANIRLSGGDPSVADGLRIANSRMGRIAAWALVASTVGLLLRMLEERFDWLGRLVIGLIGVAWTLITYFMVPVIVFEDLTIGDSIKRSTDLFKRNWGTEVTSGFSFGLIFFLLGIPGLLLAFVGFAVHPLVGIVLGVLYFLTLAAVSAAVKGIFTVALYRYATQNEVPAGFSQDLVRGAFAPRS